MVAVTLRRAVQSDAAAIGAVHVASWLETYDGIIPDEMLKGQSVEARTEMWRGILASAKSLGGVAVFVVEHDGNAIGFGSCGPQRDHGLSERTFGGEFYAVYVRRSHQRTGVGRSIITAMSRELLAAGHSAASLWVLCANMSARVFYEGLGGTIVGERTDRRPEGVLAEYAYGWRELSTLTGSSPDPSPAPVSA